jgi:hypothetical protein
MHDAGMIFIGYTVGTATGAAILGWFGGAGTRTEFEKWATPRTSLLVSVAAWRPASAFWDF